MGSRLGPSLANAFLAHHEQNWLDNCPLEYRPLYYQRYVDDIFVLFISSDHLNSCHVNMSFTIETEQNNKISFPDVNVIREQGKFVTMSIENQLLVTYTPILIAFFLPDSYKIAMIYTLMNRCFRTCSSWSIIHQHLLLLREIFQKNGYPENFIERCFKLFLNRFHILKEKVPTVEKKHLRLVLPYLGTISL